MGGKVGGMIKKLAVTAVVVSATVYAGPAVAAYLGVTGSVGVALITAGVSMATSYAVAKLIGNNMGDTEIAQDIGSYATTTLQNVTRNVAVVPQIYGEVMHGGNVIWQGNPTGNSSVYAEEFIVKVIVLADHEIDSIIDVYYKNMDKKFTIQQDEPNKITTGFQDGCSYGGTERTCYMFVNIYRDGRGTGALQYIYGRNDVDGGYYYGDLATDSDWVDTYVPQSKAICIFTHIFSEVEGIENTNNAQPSFHLKGRKLQEIDSNGSTGVWSYQNSASFVILDYLRRVYPIGDEFIDFSGFMEAHGHCVSKNFNINIVLNATSNAVSILQELLQSCNGNLLFTRQGKYKLLIFSASDTSIANLDDGYFLENSLMVAYGKTATLPNLITVSWIDPKKKWQVVESHSKRDELIDLEGKHEQKLNLRGVTNETQAQYIADTTFQKARFRDGRFDPPIALTFDTTTALEESEIGDVFHLTNEIFENGEIILRILGKEIRQDGKITINAVEYCSTHF